MAATVFATPGKLFLTPTAVTGSSGTEITGIAEGDISLALDAQIETYRTGVGSSAGFDSRLGRVEAAVLLINLRNQSATGLKLQFSHLTTNGTALRPTGGTATAEFASLPTFALIVRPTLTTEKYVYSPNWSAELGSRWLAEHSEVNEQLGGSVLALLACKPSNASGPPYEWGTSAEIAAAYSITE